MGTCIETYVEKEGEKEGERERERERETDWVAGEAEPPPSLLSAGWRMCGTSLLMACINGAPAGERGGRLTCLPSVALNTAPLTLNDRIGE